MAGGLYRSCQDKGNDREIRRTMPLMSTVQPQAQLTKTVTILANLRHVKSGHDQFGK